MKKKLTTTRQPALTTINPLQQLCRIQSMSWFFKKDLSSSYVFLCYDRRLHLLCGLPLLLCLLSLPRRLPLLPRLSLLHRLPLPQPPLYNHPTQNNKYICANRISKEKNDFD